MGFILFLLFICAVIGLIVFICESDFSSAIVGFLIPGIICSILMAFVWGNSYDNYVIMQERLSNINQYAQTIRSYAKLGVAEFKTGSANGTELTDLKYQNYQAQIGKMITDLRDQITKYNTRLIGKNVMKKSWVWNWCIVSAPEGSVILQMSDYTD
jgi:hypothetical protein